MITAKTTEMDMIRGLDNGADDYIRKPFSVMELLSRIRALLRRAQTPAQMPADKYSVCRVGAIMLDPARHYVCVHDTPVNLTHKEYDLLHYLMLHEGLVFTREVLMQAVWGFDFEGESRTVDMHIKTLRQKLGDAACYVHTVRGVGYCVKTDDIHTA